MSKKTATPTELGRFANNGGLDFISKEIGATDSDLVDLINWPLPECTEVHGKVIMAEVNRNTMNALFKAFGAPVRVETSKLAEVLRCFTFCQAALGKPVKSLIRKNTTAEQFLPDWPQDWRDYANAVMRGEIKEAEALFAKLTPLEPGVLLPTLDVNGKRAPLERWEV